MSELEVALARAKAARDDDGPRLVLADLLQAQGDARGEFIAVQCELARLGFGRRHPSWDWVGDALVEGAVDDAHVRALRRRETALLSANEAGWSAAALKVARKVGFERGFIARAELGALGAAAQERVEALFASEPMLEAIDLVGHEKAVLAALLASGAQLRELAASAILAERLLTAPGLALTRLHLRGEPTFGNVGAEQAGVRQLLGSAALMSRLSQLALTQLGLTPADLRAALDAAGEVVRLDLRQNALGEEGAAVLAKSPKARSIRVLALLGNSLGPKGASALAQSEHLRQLRALDLRRNKLGPTGVAPLVDGFPALRVLDVTGNALGVKGAAALAKGRGLGALRELCLQQTSLDDGAVKALAEAPLLRQLEVLNLRSNKVTDEGARALAALKGPSKLVQVNLNNNLVSAAGKRALAESEFFAAARVLA